MTTVSAVKSGPVGKRKDVEQDEIMREKLILGGEKTSFRTQMINGKPQIYFDALGLSNASSSFARKTFSF